MAAMNTTMNSIIIALFVLFSLSVVNAQTTETKKPAEPKQTPAAAKPAEKTPPASEQATGTEKKPFVDKDGDGVDDALQQPRGREGQMMGRVRFIDKDGDGICDERAGGIGLRLREGRAKGMMGRHGKGAGKGPGGNN